MKAKGCCATSQVDRVGTVTKDAIMKGEHNHEPPRRAKLAVEVQAELKNMAKQGKKPAQIHQACICFLCFCCLSPLTWLIIFVQHFVNSLSVKELEKSYLHPTRKQIERAVGDARYENAGLSRMDAIRQIIKVFAKTGVCVCVCNLLQVVYTL